MGCWLLGASASQAKDLVVNGSFQQANPTNAVKPLGWDLPDGLGVQWVPCDQDAAHGKAIRIDTRVSERDMVARWKAVGLDKWVFPNPAKGAIAGTYGLSFYSDTMPVASGTPYRVSFDYRGPSGGAKVWVRAYGMFRGELRRRYETIVNCRTGTPKEWTHFSQVFFPTRHRPRVSEMKLMLYAFWPKGVYWFDNLKLEPITVEQYERDYQPNR